MTLALNCEASGLFFVINFEWQYALSLEIHCKMAENKRVDPKRILGAVFDAFA
jgi:hypothetical protein